MLVAENLRSPPYGPFTQRCLDVSYEKLGEHEKIRLSLDSWLHRYTNKLGKRGLELWMVPQLKFDLGTTLDVRLPESYAPTEARMV